MGFTRGISTINELAASQSVISSIVPVDITGFTFTLEPGRKLKWAVRGVLTVPAAAGIRLRAHCTVAPANYNAEWLVAEPGGPTTSGGGLIAEADFTLAGGPPAGNYLVWGQGEVTAGATATVFSIQFAQETSTASNNTLNQGATLELWQM